MTSPKDLKKAFRWIVGIFRKYKIPFQITGGLAASLYGSPRKFNDIDILMRPASLPVILPHVKKHIIFGPGRYKDRYFDSYMMTLKIFGTKVDIGMECRICNYRTGRWYQTPGPTKFIERKIFGKKVRVEAKNKLIRIKQILGRERDLEDVKAMQQAEFVPRITVC